MIGKKVLPQRCPSFVGTCEYMLCYITKVLQIELTDLITLIGRVSWIIQCNHMDP